MSRKTQHGDNFKPLKIIENKNNMAARFLLFMVTMSLTLIIHFNVTRCHGIRFKLNALFLLQK